MPTVTGAQLLAQIRSIADEPDDGSPTKGYCTDDEIYAWLSDHYRAAVRGMARHGYPYSLTREDFAAPGASCTLATQPVAINGVWVTRGTSVVRLPRIVSDPLAINNGTSQVAYWMPEITSAGVCKVALFPSETSDTVTVKYTPDAAEMASATSVWLSGAQKRLVVLCTALDCYTKRDKLNQSLVAQYQEAMIDAEAEASQYTEQVVANTDDVYRPGDIINRPYVDPQFDYGVYLIP